jgi:hypothetical protein
VRDRENLRRSLTEVGSVSIEYGQTDKLLGDLGPGGDNKPNEVPAAEYGQHPVLKVLLSKMALLGNSGGHDIL